LQKTRRICGIVLAILFIAFCFMPQTKLILCLPPQQKLVVGESSKIDINLPAQLENKIEMQVIRPSENVFASPEDPPISVNKNNSGYEIKALKPGKVDVEFRLLGLLPLKSIAIESVPTERVIVGGHSIGVLLQSNGIMVVGFAPVIGSNGEKEYPARDQGMQIGDLITKIDEKPVNDENNLAAVIDEKKGGKFVVNIKRKGRDISIPVQAVYCPETGRYRIGLYVRDGVVGVGTLTFWKPDTGEYAALGHMIIDADTKQGIDVLKGRIVSASIQTIKPGEPGKPGEKIGVFKPEGEIEGDIIKNTYFGIYGRTNTRVKNTHFDYTLEVGYAHQVKEGKAQIYTVVNGLDIEKFDIFIEKVYPERKNGKGMIIRVTDNRLLSLTGGIIQGMSGSPIIQDSKIVGAVTHVFLNDPQRGYGIFMDNMFAEMPADKNDLLKVSTN